MESRKSVLIVSTMDTKAKESSFLRDCLESQGLTALLLDAGIRGRSPIPVYIGRDQVAEAAGSTLSDVQQSGHEGRALDTMISGAIRCAKATYDQGKIHGLIGLGGSMGTTLGTAVMRAFPVGFPKVMISTMASRNTRSFVGTKDILMLHSICDLAGLNRITKVVLREGALALAGMVKGGQETASGSRPLAVLSTLGTTESCAVRVREALEKRGFEVVTFHTVGSGGEAMEALVREQDVNLVVDLSLHELADHFFGGDYDAGPQRGTAALEKGIPTLLIPGNMDFLVTGPLEVAKARFAGRSLHAHNAAITAVCIDAREMAQLAGAVSELSRKSKGPTALMLPMGGLSAFDSPGGPLENPSARRALAAAFKSDLPNNIRYIQSPHHINDPEFSKEVVDCVDGLLETARLS